MNTDDLIKLLATRGLSQYGGEAVSQLEHALQCATLAEAAGQSNELIVACLLHDVGHLLPSGQAAIASDQHSGDDRHEYRAIPYLRSLFPPAITEPIRLHVQAKRYLCAVEPGYWEELSPASKQSLELQGGAFSIGQAKQFMTQPYAAGAVQLRRWDDQAKIPHLSTPDLTHFHPYLLLLTPA